MLANSNLFDNIPNELKELDQWLCWRYEEINGKKPTKIPYCVKTGYLSSVTNPASWCNFLNANSALNSNLYSGLGFVFTDNDEYCFIDLDYSEDKEIITKQLQIQKDFDSYSEVSPSGKGLHIIIKGSIPKGIKKPVAEIYSSGRYACMTGNVFNNKPIKDYQEKLTELYNELAGTSNPLPTSYVHESDQNEKHTDEYIILQCRNPNSRTSELFGRLYSGNWNSDYSSQSEGDLALANIIAYYTDNRNQVQRIFLSSGLGKRNKAKRPDYINGLIKKAFDQKLPTIDFEGYREVLEKQISQTQKEGPVAQQEELAVHSSLVTGSNPVRPTNLDIDGAGSSPAGHTGVKEIWERGNVVIQPPPGYVGLIAKFLYGSSPYPSPEISIGTALSWMAGVCGSAYNVSNTGLNIYILCLAPTGYGKEAARTGINLLNNAIKNPRVTSSSFSCCPAISNYMGGDTASGQAIYRAFSVPNRKCQLMIFGEFVQIIEKIYKRNDANAKSIKDALLDLYGPSGEHQSFPGKIYADSKLNIAPIQSPALSVLGDGTISHFNELLVDEIFNQGLLPRFTIIRCDGPEPYLNKEPIIEPSEDLVTSLCALIEYVESKIYPRNGNRVINHIPLSKEAYVLLLDEIENFTRNKKIGANNEIIRSVWTRVRMSIHKIAGLIAVGDSSLSNVIIYPKHIYWAMDLVFNSTRLLLKDNEEGKTGDVCNETNQQNELIRVMKEFINNNWLEVKGYLRDIKCGDVLHKNKIIPYRFINKKLSSVKTFSKDRLQSSGAMERSLKVLIQSDIITEINKNQLEELFGTRQRAFCFSDTVKIKKNEVK